MEPLVARRILPWFGGSAAVWSTCLVFYQLALLGGYAYARLLTRKLGPRGQAAIHIALLAASLLALPIGPGNFWRPVQATHPAWLIFATLTVTIGLPFIVLSATSPLLQTWLAAMGSETPYRMFALSNAASLAALLAYPSLVEPLLGTGAQSAAWSLLYGLFAVLCATAAWHRRSASAETRTPGEEEAANTSGWRSLWWFGLAACGSMLLLSVTNHINQNVAAVPLLWVLPLATYLLSFVFSFGWLGLYRRSLWIRLLAFALGILGYAIYNINSVIAIPVSLPIFLGGLFVSCLFCHGELNRLRPPAAELATFYLIIAAGGAAGAMFIGLAAPNMFAGVYELPVTLVFTALLALGLTWEERAWAPIGLWIAVAGCMVMVTVMNVRAYHENALSVVRSFYGSLRVVQKPHAGPEQQRVLFHGTIEHGAQFLQAPRRSRPTTYYGPDSGAGILLRECFSGPKRVGVVGLGVGTVAAYGRPGDEYHFYEINSQVVDIAQSLFFYLRESAAAVRITQGDGRLALERETASPFDVLLLDAFSGDAIPVHLLTREALALYRRHLTQQGVIAFHVSNDFLDLTPAVAALARDAGYRAVLVHNHEDQDEGVFPADWVLVTKNDSVLGNTSIRVHSQRIDEHKGIRIWSDDYNNLLEVFKAPTLRR